LNDIFFVNANTGWILPGNVGSTVRKTVDGGDTWVELTPAPGQLYVAKEIFALDENYVWYITYGNLAANQKLEIFRSTDGGESWSRVEITDHTGSSTSWASVFFVNNLIGYAGCSKFYKSTDGGASWVAKTDIAANGYQYAKAFFDISFSVQFRSYDVSDVEPIDRTTQGSMVSDNVPLNFDTQDSGQDSSVRVVCFRAVNMAIYTTITNMKFYLYSKVGFTDPNNQYYCDITDTWTQNKTPAQVHAGTPGYIPETEPGSTNLTKIGGGDIQGGGHADTSQYVYLAFYVGAEETAGFKDFNYKLVFDYY